jgi:hypothetical protein
MSAAALRFEAIRREKRVSASADVYVPLSFAAGERAGGEVSRATGRPSGCPISFLRLRRPGGRQRLSSLPRKCQERDECEGSLYRTKTPDGGAEYARVVYGIASPPGEIPRPLYEARGYNPRFDNLPIKGELEAARPSNTEEADSRDVVTTHTAISDRLMRLREKLQRRH